MVKQCGHGSPLILLHSSMSSHRQWQALANELASERRCFLPDLTGYGANGLPQKQPWSLDAEAEALLQNLPVQIRQQPVDLIGHSYGGALALHLARNQKLTINQLVLFEPVAFHLLRQIDAAADLWQEIRTLADTLPGVPPVTAAQCFIDYWQHQGYFAALPGRMQQQLATQVAKVSLDFQALSEEPSSLEDYAANVRCRVLLLTGSHSRAPAKFIAQALASVLSQVEFVTLNCGHMGPVTEAELVNPLIKQFLQR